MSQICPASHRTRCDITPLLGFHANKKEKKLSVLEVRREESSTDSYTMFLFAMRSPKTREMHWKIKDVFRLYQYSLLDLWGSVPKPSVIEQNMIMDGPLVELFNTFRHRSRG